VHPQLKKGRDTLERIPSVKLRSSEGEFSRGGFLWVDSREAHARGGRPMNRRGDRGGVSRGGRFSVAAGKERGRGDLVGGGG